jgi:pimeloyl-ACP methyl ester carboxylesterase
VEAGTSETDGDGSEAGAAADRAALETLVERFDASVFDVGRPRARLRLQRDGKPLGDVVIDRGQARLLEPGNGRPDAEISATDWEEVARSGGLAGFRRGRVRLHHDLHLGVGFLAATAPPEARARLRIRPVRTSIGRMSIVEAGSGPAVLAIHGLGATKASLLPTVAALGREHRTIAVDLPGFGDSVKPIGAPYDPPFFARAIVALLDALGLERADVLGNSMGGRVAIETGLRYPDRVRRLGLLAPSLAWLRARPWAPLLRLVPTELGLIQPAPRAVVERIVRTVVPRSEDQWTAAGIDEFLRSYLTPRGRAAFYAAARNIYLEEPHGPDGFWTRLPSLRPPSLFVWGKRDMLVPIGFARHVREVLPGSEHLELDCGHVPQLERPRETHDALARFLGASVERR